MSAKEPNFDAVVLDVDGVVTDTARLHERAWKALFDAALPQLGDAQPFTHDDYREHVDGKPRVDGLRALLKARGLEVDDEQIASLAADKDQRFQALLASEGVTAFDDAVKALRGWRRLGLGVAFVSASRNAGQVLEAAGVADLADLRVDGRVAAELGLSGKRALFREAARRLRVEPASAVAIEDAVAGVAAARDEGFGLVVGVSREGDGGALRQAGAHRVVARLTELPTFAETGSVRASALASALCLDLLMAHVGRRRLAVFLDYDGTLSPIVDQPSAAELPEPTREALRALVARCPVAVVSGRDRQDVASRLGVEGLWVAGSHGFDVAGPDGRTFEADAGRHALPELKAAAETLTRDLAHLPGVLVERKRFALAVHYRMAPDAAAEVTRTVHQVASKARHLTVRPGRKVLELRPDVAWDKGRAVERVLALLPGGDEELTPLYVGDDHTDEDAFRFVSGRGVGVLVGAPLRPTRADLRLADPREVAELLRMLASWIDHGPRRASWTLSFDRPDPERERHREALCTLGNGNFATRGAAEEEQAGPHHYPGTYLAGGYDRIATEVRGEVLVNEDLVNWPNWLRLSFRPVGGEWLSVDACRTQAFAQTLDLRRGVLSRVMRLRDRDGRQTVLTARRLVSMDDPHVGALSWELLPENWSGPVEIRSSLDGTVRNAGVARYGALRGEHLTPLGTGASGPDLIWLDVCTRQSRVRMAQIARTRVNVPELRPRRVDEHGDRVDQTLLVDARPGRAIEVDKVVSVHTSRDPASSDPLADARERVTHLPGFGALEAAHARRWAQIWKRCDITLGPGLEETTRVLRLHLFHLMQVVSPHIIDRDVGVPARGLHGEAYRGHVFWDELFIQPFLDVSWPELTRELLMYRYRRLDAARRLASALGLRGAVYPWQSGSNGREESQRLHLNPRSGRWVPDETDRQRHIGAAVAWNVWRYYGATGDHEFLAAHGAEMLVEIARFWASLATWDEGLGRFRIRGVVGPDEFHTRLPGSGRPGLDDNAYTNVMAAWCLRVAGQALEAIGPRRAAELTAQLGVTDEERRHWDEVARRLRVVFDGHVISQFDGYAGLEELDWDGYRGRYGDIQRLDRLIEAEGDDPNRYKASKQADVLMLFYLFTEEQLVELLDHMGYRFEPAWIAENVDYYVRRTSHGSTLSRVVHAWVLARLDRARSWSLFQEALRSDVADIQGGTTSEGIHLGAMAGTVDLVQRGYTGAAVRDRVLWLDPRVPDPMPCLRTSFLVGGAWLSVVITSARLEVVFANGWADEARVGFAGQVHLLRQGESLRFELSA